ncbi:VWA domain-containing protein [Microlunatus endophyticus]
MALALVLCTVSPAIGGVLVRGEKGTAKSTMVRALAAIMPAQQVVDGCRFGCDPADPDPGCPDGPHHVTPGVERPARLVELPVGATEDRVIGSLDLQRVLGEGRTIFEPGLLAAANRGILYVDEVNLLHDHLVDLLLDAAAMGRSTVERDGISVTHAAQIMLVGTMNPEEGELRPQLLDRFGLTVEVAAPREPDLRAEVISRRLRFDADPVAFAQQYAASEQQLREQIVRARRALPAVVLGPQALTKIAAVCAGFDVDGMRADIVTARAAVAHAAWQGRDRVTRDDIRAAARLALPHRRRRNPFDAPGLDEDLLDELLGDDEPDTDPEPEPPEPDDPDGNDQGPDGNDQGPDGGQTASDGDDAPQRPDGDRSGMDQQPADRSSDDQGRQDHRGDQQPEDRLSEDQQGDDREDGDPSDESPAVVGRVAAAEKPYRTRLFTATGLGTGAAGRRSRALTSSGRVVRAADRFQRGDRVHLPGTVRAAARRGLDAGRLAVRGDDLRSAITEGRESNLVLLVVDASGSMAAKRRMEAVKTAALSLLLDAYQRRDRVCLITFAGRAADLALPPTSSVEVAARRLTDLPTGGRTPLAEGLLRATETVRIERIRDPRRRPLMILITDGRATAGPDPLDRAGRAADLVRAAGIQTVLIDCETGRFRMGLASRLAARIGASYTRVDEVAADTITGAVAEHRPHLGAA